MENSKIATWPPILDHSESRATQLSVEFTDDIVPQLKSRFCCDEKETENETTTALVRTRRKSYCSEEAVKATNAKVALAVWSEY